MTVQTATRDVLMPIGQNMTYQDNNGLWRHSFLTDGLPAGMAFSRASAATDFSPTGALQTENPDVPRFDINPTTLAPVGLLLEGARTNAIRNSQAAGVALNTNPTNWSGRGTVAGITTEIVGFGTQNGLSYIDWQLSGTSTAASGTALLFETNTAIAAANNQPWSLSAWYACVAGSTANMTINQRLRMLDSVATDLGSLNGSAMQGALTTTMQRFSSTVTTTHASTTNIRPMLNIAWASGVVINATLRVAAPQCGQNSFPSSYIPTTSASATRAVDLATFSTLGTINFNPAEGTIIAEFEMANIGSTGTQRILQFHDGSASNRLSFGLTSSGLVPLVVSSGTVVFNPTISSVSPNTVYKIALAYKANDFGGCLNGGTVVTTTTGNVPVGLNTLSLGNNGYDTAAGMFGWIRRLTYAPVRYSNTQLQALTA